MPAARRLPAPPDPLQPGRALLRDGPTRWPRPSGCPIESVGELAEGHGPEALRLLRADGGGDGGPVHPRRHRRPSSSTPWPPTCRAKARYQLRLLKGEVWVVQSTGDDLEIVDHLRQEPRR